VPDHGDGRFLQIDQLARRCLLNPASLQAGSVGCSLEFDLQFRRFQDEWRIAQRNVGHASGGSLAFTGLDRWALRLHRDNAFDQGGPCVPDQPAEWPGLRMRNQHSRPDAIEQGHACGLIQRPRVPRALLRNGRPLARHLSHGDGGLAAGAVHRALARKNRAGQDQQ